MLEVTTNDILDLLTENKEFLKKRSTPYSDIKTELKTLLRKEKTDYRFAIIDSAQSHH